ncbi:unnamed protein product [Acanthoscelides obtectus]|uniref:Uncharacterized protein n=1 Tax=Acanthoscelides obtectus TaxID=200917 RepID=A0A9P0VRC4_ACAOB|nr:unnamed protein product [Acanthoscelides obtectus]CAH2017992.1 unnamed protein product [Acanthoscelides obtectus]CAK1643845.1 hypothetical protein AOBTE_LOCUS13699 [Acanthoscelides obtectus]CAK1682813.1 hypothetical protein AOBTE_LOCUS33906 [Acanthoscelides obtectus]
MTLIPTLMVSKSPVSMAEIKNFHVRIFLSKIYGAADKSFIHKKTRLSKIRNCLF